MIEAGVRTLSIKQVIKPYLRLPRLRSIDMKLQTQSGGEAMKKMDPRDELTLWVGATHYHLGRTTYAVSDFCNLLIGSWNELR